MALRIDQWHVEARPGGWLRLRESSGQGPAVYLQYMLSGPTGHERLDLQSVVMQAGSDEALSGRTWRRIPLSQVEQMLWLLLVYLPFNGPEKWKDAGVSERELFNSSVSDVTPPSLDSLDAFFEATEELEMLGASLPSDMLVGEAVDGLPAPRIPRLHSSDGRLTDDFLQDVADVYRWATATKRSPAPAIAEIAEVPVRTAQRWVYEARKRDILPPARTGRAG